MPSCDILLAVYNGEKYGAALLESLLTQSYKDFRVIVRDNGSTDGTMAMLEAYAPRFEGRLKVLESRSSTGSALGNFSLLLQATDADYVLFADIDDVWNSNKVEHTLDLLQKANLDPEVPLYVFTDVTPVDANLKPIQESYWAFKKIKPEVSRNLNQLVVCAPMLGCASGINRSLARLAAPVPIMATGHDWWALLIACAMGKVVYSAERTMLYRVHGGNASSPKAVSLMAYSKAENRVAKVRRGMLRRVEQAQELLGQFGYQMPANKREILEQFVDLPNQNYVKRRYTLLRGAFLYPDLARNIAMLAAN